MAGGAARNLQDDAQGTPTQSDTYPERTRNLEDDDIRVQFLDHLEQSFPPHIPPQVLHLRLREMPGPHTQSL